MPVQAMFCIYADFDVNVCSKSKMEMTTPVISTGGQSGPAGDKMQFPMENKFGTDPDILPLPNDSRSVHTQKQITAASCHYTRGCCF